MRKFLYITVFLIGYCAVAQDSAYVYPTSDTIAEPPPIAELEPVKRTFDQDFKSRYTDADFDYIPQAPEKTLWQNFTEWLAALLRDLFKNADPEKSMTAAIWIIRVLAFAIIITVIYFITKAILKKEGRWIFGKDGNRKIIHADGIEKNLQAVNFEKLISDTLASGDLRLAIRYYYLWLLKRLSEKGHIQWDAEKTNSDYLHEITNPAIKDEFSYLSYLYNYIWYGEFAVDEDTFEKSKKAFERTIQSVK